MARPFVARYYCIFWWEEENYGGFSLLIRLPETFINPNMFIEYLQHLYSYIETLSPDPRAWLKWNRLKVSVKVSRSDCDVRCYSSRHSDGSIIAIAIIWARENVFLPATRNKIFCVNLCIWLLLYCTGEIKFSKIMLDGCSEDCYFVSRHISWWRIREYFANNIQHK